jgi:hypothetical protein
MAKDKNFDGMAIDQLKRGSASMPADAIEEMHVGLVSSKQDDRTKWVEERGKVEGEFSGSAITTIDFESSGISHFPFVVAATAGKDGKSLPGRIWITSSDAARNDGTRVVFGRVVEGQEVVERLIEDTPFATEDEANAGVGVPRDTIRIQTVEIIER